LFTPRKRISVDFGVNGWERKHLRDKSGMEFSEKDLRGFALHIADQLPIRPDEARRVCELALVLVEWRNRTDPEPDQADPAPPLRAAAKIVSIASR
jgi:hypothetical protein